MRLLAMATSGVPWPRSADAASGLQRITFSVPGPGNFVSAPFELAALTGLDRSAGIDLRMRFVGGGALAIEDLENGIADYASFGLPAAVEANAAHGSRLVALVAMDDLPLYTLMVRSDLRRSVRSLADLRGLTIGVHGNALDTTSTSRQLTELCLRSALIPVDAVRFAAARQSWDTQSTMLASRTVDASMCDEPIGTELEMAGIAFPLFSSTHSADAMADALRLPAGPERASFLVVRRRFPRMFSADGWFSDAQLAQTDRFIAANQPEHSALQIQPPAAMVDGRWIGHKP